jgi:phosphoribosyl 1,2-cyclic phosphate phosphodiesterase
VFDKRDRKTYVPQLEVNLIDDAPFDVMGLRFEPIPLTHGKDSIFGFRFGNVAYLTDHSETPEASIEKLGGLDVLFLDALRNRPHPTHSTVETSVETARRLRPRRTYFTHMCHDLGHAATEALLPADIYLAYDGLEISVPSNGVTGE